MGSAVEVVRYVALAAASMTACGRIGFAGDAMDGAHDGAHDGAPPCTGPFGPPMRLDALSSSEQDWGASITADKLELYFSSDRDVPGDTDLHVATRASVADPFGAPMRLDGLATTSSDDDPFIEPDGLTLWFGSRGDIYVATRASRTDAFTSSQVVPELSTADEETAPSLTADGKTIYFSSERSTGEGGQDLYVATRPTITDSFETPLRQPMPSSNVFDCCPHVTGDGTLVYFTTTQFNDRDQIAVADRSGTGELGAATLVQSLASSDTEVDAFTSLDDSLFGFSSTRPGGQGFHDLYLMERSCP